MKSIVLGGSTKGLQERMEYYGKKPMQAVCKKRENVPVFFASDDRYLPYLDVAISSLVEHASKNYDYTLHVLHSGIDGKRAEKIMRHERQGIKIRFVNVEEHLSKIENFFNLRDYYTPAIYYRLFIVGMFPAYKKAVYLDCDTVILGDVSEIYRVNLGNNLIGAVADSVVASVPVFKRYTKEALGVDGEKYFNSGVIVMNLDGMRKANFYQAFADTLEKFRFRVAPDQDCLNVLCKGRVHYFSQDWNAMPQAQSISAKPKLVHYNLAQKPWHYDGIKHEDYFWSYARQSAFYDDIVAEKQSFTQEKARKDEESGAALLVLAEAEIERVSAK